jgi:hypothetical protein
MGLFFSTCSIKSNNIKKNKKNIHAIDETDSIIKENNAIKQQIMNNNVRLDSLETESGTEEMKILTQRITQNFDDIGRGIDKLKEIHLEILSKLDSA